MKKGFTLIELLAVIVILAIIAVIAVPIVLNIINETKDNANKRSIDMYASALKTAIMRHQMNSSNQLEGRFFTTDGKILVSEDNPDVKLEVDYSGAEVVCSVIRISSEGQIHLSQCNVDKQEVLNYSHGELVDEKFLAYDLTKNFLVEESKINSSIKVEENSDFKDLSEYIKESQDLTTVVKSGTYINKAQDDLGTSYYYRGRVTTNYVKFGSWAENRSEIRGYRYLKTSNEFINQKVVNYRVYNTLEECNAATSYNLSCTEVQIARVGDPMYWRIVRINGDGTIRMIYDGTTPAETPSLHVAVIGSSPYNTIVTGDKYSGYTYDDNGVQKDSTIKTYLETWYENNLYGTYSKYIADSIFCNNRGIQNVDSETGKITYDAKYRLKTNKNPILTCKDKNDKYTVNKEIGNGLLKYPVGLAIADEIHMAGTLVGDEANLFFYLYSGETYWTMTAYDYEINEPAVMTGTYSGLLSRDITNVTYNGVRPVINLKANVKFAGSGTLTDPYVIVE